MEKWHAANPELSDKFERRYEKGQFNSPEVSPNPSPVIASRDLRTTSTLTLEQRLAGLDSPVGGSTHGARRASEQISSLEIPSPDSALESPNGGSKGCRRASAPERFDVIVRSRPKNERQRRGSKFDVYVLPDAMESIDHPEFEAPAHSAVVAAVGGDGQ
jgi:hypothetical protein